MPNEFLSRSYLLAVFYEPAQQRTVTKKAFGGRRRWASIYPLIKTMKIINLHQLQPYNAQQTLINQTFLYYHASL